MQCNYTQSEARNITVISRGDHLIILVPGVAYVVNHPDVPQPYVGNVKTVDISSSDTITDIRKKVGATWEEQLAELKKTL